MDDRTPATREEILHRLDVRKTWYVKPLAELLDVSTTTIYRWISEGRINADKRGPHQTLVPSSEVLAHLEKLQAMQ